MLINKLDTAGAGAVDGTEPMPPTTGALPSPVPEQSIETADPSTLAGKNLERGLEASYFRGQLDEAQPHPGVGVLYDKNKKPGVEKGETAAPVSKNAPAGAGDEANAQVATEAAGWVGKPVVGTGECYDFADAVLKAANAKSAPDFCKVTKSPSQDYKWGKPIDLKDVKPGDVLQFRDHKIVIDKKIKTTKTFPDGHKEVSYGGSKQELKRGQHTAVVLANHDDGTMDVAEQHVLDHKTGELSTTVRQNKLNTKDVAATTLPVKVTHQGSVKIEVEETDTISVTGKIQAYRPQQKGK